MNSILLAIMSLSIIYLAPILYMYIQINFTVNDTMRQKFHKISLYVYFCFSYLHICGSSCTVL